MTVSRLTGPAKTRKSLPLTEKDLADVARLRQETPEREALSEMAGSSSWRALRRRHCCT